MVCVRAALIIKALEYEFKWKYDILKHFQNIFLNMISDLKIWFSRSYASSLLLLFHSQTMTPKNVLTYNFSPRYQYILQPTVLENKETVNETNLTQHGRSTDVDALDVLYPMDKKNISKKEGTY